MGIASGSVEFSSYPPFDIYVAGTGRPDGLGVHASDPAPDRVSMA